VTRRPSSYGTTSQSAGGSAGIYRGWAVVALCFAMLMLGAGPVYYAYGNYALAFAQSFNADRATINIGYTMVLLLGNLGSAPVGMMAERWPIKGVALLGVLGTAAGFALVSTASSILQVLLVFSTLIALADICIGTVVTNILVSHWFERRRGLAIGLSVIGTAVAAVIFPPLTDILFSRFGWRATFLIYAVLMLVLIPPIWFLARLPDNIAEHERLPLALRRPGGPPISLSEMFRSPAFWIVTLTIGAMIGANTGTMVSIVAFAVSRGFSSLEGSALLSVIGATSVAGKLVFGIAADRLSPVIALRIGLALMASGLIVLATGLLYPMLFGGAMLFGFGLGAMLPVWGGIVAKIFGLGSYGRALGWTRAAMAPISMVCPIFAGLISDATGDYAPVWMMFAALLALSFALTFAAPGWWRPGHASTEI